jgi:hypothetical protein
MRSSSKIWLPLTSVLLFGAFTAVAANAQMTGGASSSSSTTTEATIKGYAFKYKEKFDTYSQQIEMGISKGWLTSAQAETFKTRLNELRSVESAASHNNYPDADIAKLDKMTTKFNADLSSASTTKAPATASGDGAKSDDSTSASATAVTKKQTTTKTSAKSTKSK